MSQAYLPMGIENVHWAGPESERCAATGLAHAVRLPEGAAAGSPVPAVVMVHGWGGNESVMWIFEQALPQSAAVITPRAPVPVDEGRYAWFAGRQTEVGPPPETLSEMVTLLTNFLTSLPACYPIDSQQLLLIGFSQGAAICNSLMLHRPGLAGGMASLAGLVLEVPDPAFHSDSLAGTPIFIAHGARDEIVPVSAARHTRDFYTILGATITYGEYPTGHKMTRQGIRDLRDWVANILP